MNNNFFKKIQKQNGKKKKRKIGCLQKKKIDLGVSVFTLFEVLNLSTLYKQLENASYDEENKSPLKNVAIQTYLENIQKLAGERK